MSVLDHMGLDHLRRGIARGLGMDWVVIRRTTDELNQAANLRMAAVERQVATLSGGNIQRVLLTQILAASASVYVLSYPNRGLDVLSCRQVHDLILKRRDEGAGVVLVSEDLDELMLLADRIVVLHDGRVAGVREPAETDRAELGRLMLGTAA
jgi:simple sugar transport system ATP-binding protein